MIIKKKNYQKNIDAQKEKERAEQEELQAEISNSEEPVEESFIDLEQEIFDIDNIDFTQREERRTGTRRRGYRRIDEKTIISRAQEEVVQIKEAAYQDGYNQGLEAAQNDIVAFKSNLGAFMSAEKRVFDAIMPDLVEMALDISKKILKHEAQTDPEIVIDTVMDILKTIPKNEPKITINVSPAQLQYVKDNLPDKITLLGIESKINLVSDPNMSEGGCLISTNNGIVDATIEAQFDIIQKALRGI